MAATNRVSARWPRRADQRVAASSSIWASGSNRTVRSDAKASLEPLSYLGPGNGLHLARCHSRPPSASFLCPGVLDLRVPGAQMVGELGKKLFLLTGGELERHLEDFLGPCLHRLLPTRLNRHHCI